MSEQHSSCAPESEKSDAVEYRDIPGFPGYRVGSDGSVWSSSNRRKRSPGQELESVRPHVRNRYLCVGLYSARVHRQVKKPVHYLVLLAFTGERPCGCQVAHNNGNRLDNRAENLRWATPKENSGDKQQHGTLLFGRDNATAKLTNELAILIVSRFNNGEHQSNIAKDLNVAPATVRGVLTGKTWSHVTGLPRRSRVVSKERRVAIATMASTTRWSRQ